MRINESREGEILCAVLVRKQVPAVGRCCWGALPSQRFLSAEPQGDLPHEADVFRAR